MLLIIAIVVAAGCLAIGLLTGQAMLCWVALAVSLVAVLYFGCLLLRQRRGDARDVKAQSSEKRDSAQKAESSENAQPVAKSERVADTEATANTEPAATSAHAEEPAVPIGGSDERVSKVAHGEERESAGAANPAPAAAGGQDAVEWVKVARGRRRFHLESCSLLDGKTVEEISLEEAREEGFTACTKCIPDLAMVAGPASEVR